MRFIKIFSFLILITCILFLYNYQNLIAQNNDLDLLSELDVEMQPEKKNSDDDLFNDLDEEIEDKTQKQNLNILSQLYKNLSGNIRARYYWFCRDLDTSTDEDEAENNNSDTDSEEIDSQRHFVDSIIKISDFISYKSLRLDFNGWAEIGNQKDTYLLGSMWPQDKERHRRYFEANELYLSLFTDHFDLTLGRKIMSNGVSTLYSPANRYTNSDINDPLDPKEYGIWQTKLDLYIYDLTITTAVLPAYNSSKSPSSTSRWAATWADSSSELEDDDSSIDNSTIEENYPDLTYENMSYFFRMKIPLGGWDLFLSCYHGNNSNWVLKNDETTEDSDDTENTDEIGEIDEIDETTEDDVENIIFTKEIVPVFNASAGFSTTLNSWEFHAEALYNFTYDYKDDSYLSYVAGFRYTIDEIVKNIFLDKIDITIEYAREWKIDKQDAENFEKSSDELRIGKNDLITFIVIKINENFSFNYLLQYEYEEFGHLNCIGLKYRLTDDLKLISKVELYEGNDESHFGRWKDNDRLIAILEYSF